MLFNYSTAATNMFAMWHSSKETAVDEVKYGKSVESLLGIDVVVPDLLSSEWFSVFPITNCCFG